MDMVTEWSSGQIVARAAYQPSKSMTALPCEVPALRPIFIHVDWETECAQSKIRVRLETLSWPKPCRLLLTTGADS